MNFELSQEQAELRENIVRFAQKHLNTDVMQYDERSEFDHEKWRNCAKFGIQGLMLPKQFGGTDNDIITTSVAMEALGYGCHDQGLLFSIHAHMWAVQIPILAFGTPQQQERYLPRLADGSCIGGHAMSEPGAGSDAFALTTHAKRKDDVYVLNGAKTFVTNAPVADVFLVFATVNRARKMWGISAFLVDRDTPGLTVGKSALKMGLRTSPMADVVFEDCEVPAENLLGSEGQGAAVFNNSMKWERANILGSDIGAMERELENAIEYAKTRQAFGKSIGNFQLVAGRIADMKIRLETSRLLLYRAAAALSTDDRDAALYGAMAKHYISEAAVQSSLDAIKVHGGYGYMVEFEVERGLRNAIGGQLYSGTSDVQSMLIARHLGLTPES